MPSTTNEQALEAAIEKVLTGTCLEDTKASGNIVNEPNVVYNSGKGFYIGNTYDFNVKYALDEVRFWNFLETTQEDELNKLKRSADWKLKILERFDRMVKKYGLLRLDLQHFSG